MHPIHFYSYIIVTICISGSCIHQSLREDDYGESYRAGDIIGCYIRLDDVDPMTNNEIRFFKNGIDQGVAFTGFAMGLYFPAVSIYMKVGEFICYLFVIFLLAKTLKLTTEIFQRFIDFLCVLTVIKNYAIVRIKYTN